MLEDQGSTKAGSSCGEGEASRDGDTSCPSTECAWLQFQGEDVSGLAWVTQVPE